MSFLLYLYLSQEGEFLVGGGFLCEEALLEVETDTARLPVVLDELGGWVGGWVGGLEKGEGDRDKKGGLNDLL